jgi:hypothetical protein
MADEHTNSLINNTQATIIERGGTLNTGTDFLMMGLKIPYATILSARLYDRVLTPEEIENNAKLDQKRYLTPPPVTIDGVPCTEVVVLSSHFLMCKVPAGSSGTGDKTVIVDGISYGNVYKYVDPDDDFYISAISRIIGSAGEPLTLTGNKFEDIHEVKVGNEVCLSPSINTAGTAGTDTYSFNLPANPTGEVDITITMKDATTYRFAKVFEYK